MAENDKDKLNQAMGVFKEVYGYKDYGERLYECQKKNEQLLQKEDEERLKAESKKHKDELEAKQREAKIKKVSIIATSIVVALIAVVMI